MSDRAQGLVKLGKPEYMDVCSMPDLFHFQQELSKGIGASIGKAWKKSKQAYQDAKDQYGERKELESAYLKLDMCRNRYQQGVHSINKAVQPFTENGEFKSTTAIEKTIISSIVQISKQSKGVVKEIKTETVTKLLEQIPDLLKGIRSWQEWAAERADKFVVQTDINLTDEELKKWLLHYLLPVFIWELALRRTHTKPSNKKLIQAYKEILQKARDKLKGSNSEKFIAPEQYHSCVEWAQQIARTFQRSSSQVEGRNGYLAFVHKASRGISDQRLKVLTVVHNFDIRSWDGKTPAERLFKQDFPDLFEFVLENVTGFREPRRFKSKALIVNPVAL